MSKLKQKTIAILGMHRSGTSMLTGSLEEAGLYLGEVNQRAKNNKKGNKESLYLMDFLESILVKNGGAWHNPLVDIKWSADDREELKKYIQSFSDKEVWGFKDPRTIFFLDEWKAHIPHLKMVGIYRHPMSVALSLQKRNNFKIQRGLNLWKIYNRRLLALHKAYKFPIIEFTEKPLKLENSIKAVVDILGLEQKDSFNFFLKKLIHNPATDIDLPHDVTQIYKRLKLASLKPALS